MSRYQHEDPSSCNTTVYLSIVLCNASLPSKTDRENVLYVVGDYSQLFLPPPYFLNISNQWSWGVLFTVVLKVFLGWVYYEWFLVCLFELIFFSPKIKNLLHYWFIDGVICWTISVLGYLKSYFFLQREKYIAVLIYWWV